MIPRHNHTSIVTISPHAIATPRGAPVPRDFGLPEKFSAWRPGQWDAIQLILDSPQRFIVLCCPTGSGKSVTSVAAALLSGRRTVICTSTKGLQTQYVETLGELLHDVRGMANYTCPIAPQLGLSERTSVAEAPCQCGYPCALRFNGGCEYFSRYRAAQSAPLVIANLQAWQFDALKGSDGLHIPQDIYDPDDEKDPRIPIDMLVADEASDCGEELSRFIGVQISRRECLQLHLDWPDQGLGMPDWRQWAGVNHLAVTRRLEEWQSRLRNGQGGGNGSGRGWSREFKLLRDMQRKLSRLSTVRAEDDWVMDEQTTEGDGDMYAMRFAPLSPARYAEQALWRSVKKIVLMSATIRPKTCELLGIPPDEMVFAEYPSTFPRERRPIIVVPSVQLNYRTELDDHTMIRWLHRIDAVIAKRLDRKGVIHSHSYKRAKFLKDNSEFGQYMMIHDAASRADIVEEFRRSTPPAILVSPSVGTGYDFKDNEARWIIVAKLPFASVSDKLVKARQQRDSEYSTFMAAQALIQMTGRATRAATDWSEVLLMDDSFDNWFYRRARKFMPAWWTESVEWAQGVPEPLEEPQP